MNLNIKTVLFLALAVIPMMSYGQNLFPSSGNTGIGTLTPTEELEVIGRVKAKRGLFTLSEGSGYTLQLGEEWKTDRRNMEYAINNTGTWHQLQNLWTDQNKKLRYHLNVWPTGSSLTLNNEHGSNTFKVSEGELGENKVYLHLPQAESRIVIGSWGNYLLEHKLVVKDGSALIEGNIFTNNNIGIGTSSFVDGGESYRLSVNGKVRAHEIKVYTTWADYVFKENYALKTLPEVEAYIMEHGHLPNIPSEAEVLEQGIELGTMNAKLLEKIEELTLYLIQQQKEIKHLNSEIMQLKNQ